MACLNPVVSIVRSHWLHVPAPQNKSEPVLNVVQVPPGLVCRHSHFQVPPTPSPPPVPPPVLATIMVPLRCFTQLKPDFTRTVPPTSSTPSMLAGKRFTRGFPVFGPAVVGASLETQPRIINAADATAIIIAVIRFMVSLVPFTG
jgi:hypothetical protein